MKKCILHIGQPKTGTTAVRRTFRLEDNQKYLLENNIYAASLCLSRTGGDNMENLVYKDAPVVQLTSGVSIPQSVYTDITGKEDRLSNDTIADWQYEDYTLFISDEVLCMTPTHINPIWSEEYENYVQILYKIFTEDLGFDDIEIVVFIREQSQLLESWWRQTMFRHDVHSAFNGLTFEQSVSKVYNHQGYKANLFNGYNIVSTYSKYFDNVKVCPYTSGKTLTTICDILGIDNTKLISLDTETPQHYSLELADFITQYLPQYVQDADPTILRKLDDEVEVEHIKGSVLSLNTRNQIMNEWEESNQKLVDEFNLNADFFTTQKEYSLSLPVYERTDKTMEAYYAKYLELVQAEQTSNVEESNQGE